MQCGFEVSCQLSGLQFGKQQNSNVVLEFMTMKQSYQQQQQTLRGGYTVLTQKRECKEKETFHFNQLNFIYFKKKKKTDTINFIVPHSIKCLAPV